MDALSSPPLPALNLVAVIDFKWLMAGDGHRVHVERLQVDRDYARACLALGAASGIDVLRQSARRLAGAWQIVLPAG
jgi:hypothetical protein